MKKITLTLLLIGVITISRAQYPKVISGDTYTTTVLDVLKVTHHETDKAYIAKMVYTDDCLLKDYSMYAMSLLIHLGKDYQPYQGDKVYYLYTNGDVVTYDSNGLYFVKNK